MLDDDEGRDELDESLHGERLIRLCEWMHQRGLPAPLPLPCVITAALWARIERIPFRSVQSTTFEARVQHLVARARVCLESYDVAQACHDLAELTLAFSASLPCRAEDPPRQILHLRCGHVEPLGAAITLGLPDELPPRACDPQLLRAYRKLPSGVPPAVDAAPSSIHTLRRPRGESASEPVPA